MTNFFNKLGDMAKTAADKTGDMIEIGKLNSRISAEQSNISAVKEKIGDYYYNLSLNGGDFPIEVIEMFGQIKACQQEILSLQNEISAVKGEAAPDNSCKCPSCGSVNPQGTKFCSECGGKIG